MSKILSGPEMAPKNNGEVKQLIIMLHGYGSDGFNLISLSEYLADFLPNAHFIAPNGAYPFELAPSGYQWCSLIDRTDEKILNGLRESEVIVNDFIDMQMKKYNLKSEQVALLGFSQGTFLSLHTSLRRKDQLGAVVGFAGALVGSHTLDVELKSKPPICLIHGKDDDVVPCSSSVGARQVLQKYNINIDVHLLPNLAHSIDSEGIVIAGEFIKKFLQG
jgi:phospholipase/carboxylesterase